MKAIALTALTLGLLTTVSTSHVWGQKPDPSKKSASFTQADYAAHLDKLKKKLPHKGFNIVVEKPFVVVGDMPAAQLRTRWAQGTVRWATQKLKASYFTKDPHHILDIWLFKDKASYEKHTLQLWGSKPTTPYGYYSSANRVLVMNIATGGGTLVHEIVHPFIESNFPNCPAWFNEGLGSLYEQSHERKGKIIGLTNWRLAGLKQVISKGKLPSFKDLTSQSNRTFYTSTRGNNYAQSRYLLYYLQEQGLLRKYYSQFLANRKTDPTGYRTLQQILGEKDMSRFQKNWEKYILKLTFP